MLQKCCLPFSLMVVTNEPLESGLWNIVFVSTTTNMATMWNLEILPDELNTFGIYP
jgi:hypothetical protein